MSLDEYVEKCSSSQVDIALDQSATNRDISDGLAQALAELDSIIPPAELAEWHDATRAFVQAFKDAVDKSPADAAFDPTVMFALFPMLEMSAEIESRMPADVRDRLAEAGCIAGGESPAAPGS